MWPQKPLEYWAVLIGMVLYAAARDAQREPLWTRAVKVAASAFLTFGLSPTVAPYLRGSETAAAVAVMAFDRLDRNMAGGAEMTVFSLGTASLKELAGVNPYLVATVKRAIQITTQDFTVHDGIRTVEEQKKFVALESYAMAEFINP